MIIRKKNTHEGRTIDAAQAEVLAQALKALSNPARLRIVALLAKNGERTVGDIAATLGYSQAATSQQLAALRLAGQVKVRRAGGFRFYDVSVPDLITLLDCLVRCCRTHGPR